MSKPGAHGEPESVDGLMRQIRDLINIPLPEPSPEKVVTIRERIKRRLEQSPEHQSMVRARQRIADAYREFNRSRYYTPANLIEEMISNLLVVIPSSDWKENNADSPSTTHLVCNAVVYGGHFQQGVHVQIHGARWDVEVKRSRDPAVDSELQIHARRKKVTAPILPGWTPHVSAGLFLFTSSYGGDASLPNPRFDNSLEARHLPKLSAIAVLSISNEDEPIALLYDGSPHSTTDEINESVRDFVRETLLNLFTGVSE